ncbi:MAG: hypothetical protein GEU87_10650 [Alphaproteobacteria bacterium]|nr:hypothetical protein [Alphaproteobacteria bacterium]
MTSAAALRKRRQREREREGGYRVSIVVDFDLVDALETCGFAPAGIDSGEDAEAAVTKFLAWWERRVDRLNARGVTRDRVRPDGGVNCVINRKGTNVRNRRS